jgi:hypothetical protein
MVFLIYDYQHFFVACEARRNYTPALIIDVG